MHDESPQLVERLRAGEPAAFREMVECYRRDVYALAYDLCGNHHDAEDLSQEVFIKAFRGIGSFRADARLGSWLYRIAMNAHIDNKRRKPVQLVSIDAHESADEQPRERVLELAAVDPRPDQTAGAARFQTDVEHALDALSVQERTVFVLRHYHDMKIGEISESLSIAEGTVKSLLFRSMRKLRDRLSHYRDEVGDLA
ncbi:MAG TPA: RNA polymerase sigma factor [Candidatus Krumholzibacteria bacterium]|nr:RNA polymerase sigma factor [Candidatus Krumholzibacteria bacterium]